MRDAIRALCASDSELGISMTRKESESPWLIRSAPLLVAISPFPFIHLSKKNGREYTYI